MIREMEKFIVYDKEGEILRVGTCSLNQSNIQADNSKDEFVMRGNADDVTQKIEFDGFDIDGQSINPRIVDKTPEEIEADKPLEPKSIPYEQQKISITNEQYQNILGRLTELER